MKQKVPILHSNLKTLLDIHQPKLASLVERLCHQTSLLRWVDTTLLQASNPFMFKHVTHLKSSQHLDDIGPCVVMATPSMLQSGLSRYLCHGPPMHRSHL